MATFLPETLEENPFFGVYMKNIRRLDKVNFARIVGFHKDEVGCPYSQVFTTNFPFGPVDGDT